MGGRRSTSGRSEISDISTNSKKWVLLTILPMPTEVTRGTCARMVGYLSRQSGLIYGTSGIPKATADR
jgi:hypothetical protein